MVTSLLLLLVVAAAGIVVGRPSENTIRYQIQEELPAGTRVGNNNIQSHSVTSSLKRLLNAYRISVIHFEKTVQVFATKNEIGNNAWSVEF